MGAGPGGGMGGMGGGVGQIGMQNLLAQQHREMEALERRGSQGQGRGMTPDPRASRDEADQISTRSLALTRYKRNHELMNEVFQYAAFGHPTKYRELRGKNLTKLKLHFP
ncbi:hypothetical protein FIBSPDRAFT_938639 [Athelia psychrophila]|uniref:Uncharacterized protein n=1 Tax=Athelia psychrophila TaxID=1759441 RepID=A0A165Y1R0_9AGAM|nr:hypothetical protein FIBSPDRAFT_938639 [Fibularhizoctonia sp. CBS 109695]